MTPDIETQIRFEQLYNKNQTLPRLRQEFRVPEIKEHCSAHQIPLDFAVDLLVQMVLHKRATLATLVGLLHHHFMANRDLIPETHALQACADMLLKAAEADLVDWNPLDERFVLRIDVSDDVYAEIETYQYPLPFTLPPREVTTNRETGYHSQESHRGSLILRGGHHDDDICLDHINRVNATRLAINADTVAMVQNRWRNLDHRKDGESQVEFAQRVKAFEKYDRVSRDVIAHILMLGGTFWLTHRYDKRGRCYAQGYHVNPQGNDWNKGVIEFADKEVVTGHEKATNLPQKVDLDTAA